MKRGSATAPGPVIASHRQPKPLAVLQHNSTGCELRTHLDSAALHAADLLWRLRSGMRKGTGSTGQRQTCLMLNGVFILMDSQKPTQLTKKRWQQAGRLRLFAAKSVPPNQVACCGCLPATTCMIVSSQCTQQMLQPRNVHQLEQVQRWELAHIGVFHSKCCQLPGSSLSHAVKHNCIQQCEHGWCLSTWLLMIP